VTTAIEARLAPKAIALVAKYGVTATFTTYAAAVTDTDESTVTLGAATTYTPKITPPEKLKARWSPDGQLVARQGIEFYVPTGEGTSSPLGFVPELGGRVTVYGTPYRIVLVEPIATGDLRLLYRIEAEA
jgi:hypothetical protein